MRAHRAFRQLTNLLVRRGFHVLRFDYYGTGDSSGEGAEATLSAWLDNIGTAVAEMRDSAGVDRVSLTGLRFGASMALMASLKREDVNRVVLWDPILEGSSYLAASLGLERITDSVGPTTSENGQFPQGVVGMGGFPLTPHLKRELAAVDLIGLRVPSGKATDLIVSSENPNARELVSRWHSEGASARYRCVPSEGDWSKGDRFGSALIPQAIIKGVVEALTAKSAV